VAAEEDGQIRELPRVTLVAEEELMLIRLILHFPQVPIIIV
jgi:hypothetical protein